MNRYIFIILALSLLCVPGVIAEDLRNNDSEPVGTVTDAVPSWYAVVRIGAKKSRLYTKGDIVCSEIDINNCLRIEGIEKDALILKDVNSKADFIVKAGEKIPLEGADITFERAVQSEVIEYRYKTSKNIRDPETKDFALRNMDGKKIVLEKDYDIKASLAGLSEEEKEMFSSPEIDNADREIIKADLFENIKIKKLNGDTWAVDRKSAREALSNAGQTLASVIRSVKPAFRFGEGPSLKFNCELGDIVLNRDGFLVQNLAVAKLAEKTGIKQGDLIRSINGQPVNSLYGIFRAYMDIKSDTGVKAVNVDILREGKPKILVYNVR